jgi:hypothetical protein
MNVLYKYCDHVGAVKILEALELKLPYFSEVNDPLECLPFLYCPDDKATMKANCLRTFERNGVNPPANWEQIITKGELRKILEDGMRGFIKEWNQRSCLLSVSKTAQNTVMWSHYADKHKGVVIGVDFDKLFKIYSVNYSQDRPRLNILHDFTPKISWEIVSTKSVDWSYEKEFRVPFDDATLKVFAQQDLTYLKDFNGKPTWFLRLNPESIREVVFGLYTEDGLKIAIKKLIARPELQNVKLYQAKESETYTLDLDEIKS